MDRVELLAPAGNFSKLKTAIHFGADAVYVGGKAFSLRAFSDNFSNEELFEATNYCHERGKKIYVTVNIFAKNADFEEATAYLKYLEKIGVDGVIITDTGLISIAREVAPSLVLHLSTQANTTNKYTASFWQKNGIKRVVLARELSLKEVKEIHDHCQGLELEGFIHGAMCISYSGRCLLSNYLSHRDSNRGECVQACRWNYRITEVSREDGLEMEEDDRGTYILNSKDLNLIGNIKELIDSGICSFKIEGRMKSEYYLATVINAYRRAIDSYYEVGGEYMENPLFEDEVRKTAHRAFTKAFMLGENNETVNYTNSQSQGSCVFIAEVLKYDENKGLALVEMRNRFKVGDELEILSPLDSFNKTFIVEEMKNESLEEVVDAKIVQQKLWLKIPYKVAEGDILRKKV